VLGIVLSHLVDLGAAGIRLVGALPSGFPRPSLPFPTELPVVQILLGGAAIWLVSFASGLVAARSFGSKVGAEVDADAELLGIGGANIAAGLFQGFPVTVSDSRTAINIAVGGCSQAAGLVAAATLAGGMLFLSGSLEILPVPVLGAILVSAALGLIDIEGLISVWRVSRLEFVFALIGMWGAISLGVLNGVVIAVGATLLYVLMKSMRPHDALLGRAPGHDSFYKLHRVPTARQVPGLAIYLVQGSLLFFNADFVRERIDTVSQALPPTTRWFLIDASAIAQIDSTAATMLDSVRDLLEARGLALAIAELHSEPRGMLERSGLLARLGPTMLFDTVDDAYDAFKATAG
jgi:MFS superfamily sulfate permease-like transporter